MTEPARLRLYDAAISGNCYKVRLLLALLGLEYTRIPVDLRAGEAGSPEMLRLNPRGQLPVLADGERVVWDSQAILVYLARRYGAEHWLPLDPGPMASVMQWLAVAENELLYGLARARRILLLNAPGDLAEAQAMGRGILAVMEAELAGRRWLAGPEASLAEVACYPYVHLAPQAHVNLAPYPAVCRWLQAVEELPGYVPFAA